MDLQSDVVELAHAEMFKRIFFPVEDDIPDPEVNFGACLTAIIDRTEKAVYSLPAIERRAYFLERARYLLAWSERSRMPDLLTERIRSWLARLSAQD